MLLRRMAGSPDTSFEVVYRWWRTQEHVVTWGGTHETREFTKCRTFQRHLRTSHGVGTIECANHDSHPVLAWLGQRPLGS